MQIAELWLAGVLQPFARIVNVSADKAHADASERFFQCALWMIQGQPASHGIFFS
jgi:hypothetical protein